MLAEDGLLEKRRGVGMFVAMGARERLLERRRQAFAQRYVAPMVAEATRLGIDTEALLALVRQVGAVPPGAGALDGTQPSSARGGITV